MSSAAFQIKLEKDAIKDERDRDREDGYESRNNECYVDTDAFNQFLQCCFDPSHLDNTNTDNPGKLENTSFNNQNINKGKSLDIAENCTPIDLNPRCIDGCLHSLDKVHHDHSNDQVSSKYDATAAEMSEMITLNNFFSACCEDNNNENTNLKDPTDYFKYSLISPAITSASTIDFQNDQFQRHVSSPPSARNLSKIRESLKSESKSQGDHHHHLLHLHHHDQDDPGKLHTHDLIFHHHNANNCRNHHGNHHHHLHFQDQVDGQIVKHDFILPDCDIPQKTDETSSSVTSPNVEELENIPNTTLLPLNKQDECTDFLTSSICNLDNIYNDPQFSNLLAPDCCSHAPIKKDNKFIPQSNSDNEYLSNDTYCQLNLELPSQKCQNENCASPTCNGVIPHHHLHHHHSHNHHHHHHHHPQQQHPQDTSQQHNALQDALPFIDIKSVHDKHFHSNLLGHSKSKVGNQSLPKNQIVISNIQHTDKDGKICTHLQPHAHAHAHSNLNSQISTPLLSNNSPELESITFCKWDFCNEEINPENMERHIFETHLQHLHPKLESQSSSLHLNCEWDDCDFSTNDIAELLDHVPDHNGVEDFDNNNNNKQRLHICKWLNPEEGVRCDKVFTCTDDLTDHITKDHVHSGKSSYTCHWEGCSRHAKPFSQRQKIVRHLNTHTNHKPFECKVCYKKFSLDSMLKQHMRIHTGEKPYKCKVCGKNFKTSSSLTIHLRIHSGAKPMECKICGKRFSESSNLNKHMKTHFREFKCGNCLKSFETAIKFKRHQLLCKGKIS